MVQCIRGKASVERTSPTWTISSTPEEVVEVVRNVRRMTISNIPHRSDDSAISSREHPSREMHSFIREIFCAMSEKAAPPIQRHCRWTPVDVPVDHGHCRWTTVGPPLMAGPTGCPTGVELAVDVDSTSPTIWFNGLCPRVR